MHGGVLALPVIFSVSCASFPHFFPVGCPSAVRFLLSRCRDRVRFHIGEICHLIFFFKGSFPLMPKTFLRSPSMKSLDPSHRVTL